MLSIQNCSVASKFFQPVEICPDLSKRPPKSHAAVPVELMEEIKEFLKCFFIFCIKVFKSYIRFPNRTRM